MQHFLGYSSFSDESPFDPSLFVTYRKHLSLEVLNTINEKIITIKTKLEENISWINNLLIFAANSYWAIYA
jgi:hypothetical protein